MEKAIAIRKILSNLFHRFILTFAVLMSRELRYGFYAGILILIWMTVTYIMHWDETTGGEYSLFLSLFILSVAIYISILYKRDRDSGGSISFKDAFVTGISVSFIVGLMVGIYLLSYTNYINPGYVDQAVKDTQEFLRTQNASPKELEDAAEAVRAKYSTFGQLTFGLGASMLPGALISLVCALIMRRENKAI